MTIPNITINLDAKCIRCGKGGATRSGLCLWCVTKDIKAGKWDKLLKSPRSRLSNRR